MISFKHVARLLFLGIVAFGLFFALELYHFKTDRLLAEGQTFELEVQPGSSTRQIANKLKRLNISTHSHFFLLMARYKRLTHDLKAGEYLIESTTTASDLLQKMVAGDVIMRQVTFVEGWSLQEALHEMHQSVYLQHDLKNLSMADVQQKLHLDNYPEGLFFPETYTFAKNTKESEILEKAHQLLQKKLTSAWELRNKDLPYKNAYEALIVASMVEKESAVADERNIIAGVILRRLQKRMYLQIDPTVIYALGDHYTGKLSKLDLKFPSPYNTYINRGLPPTPIALAGEGAINAAMHPDDSDFIYFVANADGKHIFSATLKEHNEAVRKVRGAS